MCLMVGHNSRPVTQNQLKEMEENGGGRVGEVKWQEKKEDSEQNNEEKKIESLKFVIPTDKTRKLLRWIKDWGRGFE